MKPQHVARLCVITESLIRAKVLGPVEFMKILMALMPHVAAFSDKEWADVQGVIEGHLGSFLGVEPGGLTVGRYRDDFDTEDRHAPGD